jgi:RNA polymerase sigma-70 factor (sigma-E family)
VARGKGDDPDFEEFVAARARSLFRTAYLLTDSRESAEDLVQSALEKAYPRWWRIRRTEQPEAYVRRIIVNLANDYWRSKKGVLVHALDEEHLEERVRDGLLQYGDSAERLATRDLLLRALRALPFQMRAVLVLRYWEGLPERETADLLGCSVGTVKSQAARGLGRLRHLVGSDLGPDRGGAVPLGRMNAGSMRGSEA